MSLYLLYTMVQKSQKRPKTQIKVGSCLKSRKTGVKILLNFERSFLKSLGKN